MYSLSSPAHDVTGVSPADRDPAKRAGKAEVSWVKFVVCSAGELIHATNRHQYVRLSKGTTKYSKGMDQLRQN